MKQFYSTMILSGVLGLMAMTTQAEPAETPAKPEIVLETLLNRSLQVAQGTDVIVDRVTLPPNTSLGKRWHPGEMFVYVMDGSVVLSGDGEQQVVGKKGDVVDVPFKQIYAARTTDEGAEVLLFRIHQAGQPVRVKVE